ncbi:MAG: cyclic nucleotide-binding domain-containing protein [Endomicrobia bacterium]|nr:cyclic nucleotide-binding domain-containing protein [Endomicrobiia bacterium]MCL2799867.1 cyclic nucleotide-binding domain-containing protein [Endomicrobiia bacterium]
MIKKFLKILFIDKSLKADVAFLKKVVLFKGLSNRDLAKVALIVFKRNYVPGETVYKEKQEADVLYIIKGGQIKVNNDSNEKIVESGDFFGEMSLIADKKHDSSAVALKNSELYLIYRVKFDDFVDLDAKAGLQIMRNLSQILTVRAKCSEI